MGQSTQKTLRPLVSSAQEGFVSFPTSWFFPEPPCLGLMERLLYFSSSVLDRSR